MKLKYRHISAVKAAEKHLDKSNDKIGRAHV